MGECFGDSRCVKEIFEEILDVQRRAKRKESRSCDRPCLTEPAGMHTKNTIPFILYCNCEPLKVEGITCCYDEKCQREKFVCFLTFIFRIVDLKDGCVILELLKFKNHNKCYPNSNHHTCTPCCQLDCEDVENLVSTNVCVTFEVSSFNGIQCLSPVSL